MTSPQTAASARSLSDVQRRYLRLVAQGMTSKQIAQSVGGSHHSINVQIGVAMRILGAPSRQHAAAILAAIDRETPQEDPHHGSYEPSYDAPAIAIAASADQTPPQDRAAHGDRPWGLPVATRIRPTNTLGMAQRIGWILAIAASVALLLGGLIGGVATMLASLGRLV